MREIKFRAWAEKKVDNRFDYTYSKEEEFLSDNSEPEDRDSEEWDKWDDDLDASYNKALKTWDKLGQERYTKSLEMIANFSVRGDGKHTTPYRYELLNIMQYTGSKDVNGTEVYEDDIVVIGNFKNKKGIVVYDEVFNAFVIKNMDKIGLIDTSIPAVVEVIGNIHEMKS